MIKGNIIVNGDAGKFMAANKQKGMILAKKGRPIPPAEEKTLSIDDRNLLLGYGFNPNGFRKLE
ncbi:MAG: hypothetical protein A4E27_01381 [Methanobacterium sp. PtaU1.Bin242]|nr:MAG: hypothetical protein A4E27_01381 [Methanobacterium sp. PtaU1.Bin242]